MRLPLVHTLSARLTIGVDGHLVLYGAYDVLQRLLSLAMIMEQFLIKSLDVSALSLINSLTSVFPSNRGCVTFRLNTNTHKTYIHIDMLTRDLIKFMPTP